MHKQGTREALCPRTNDDNTAGTQIPTSLLTVVTGTQRAILVPGCCPTGWRGIMASWRVEPENVAGSHLEDEDTDMSSNMVRNSITQNPLGIIRSYWRVNLYRERMK